MLYKIKEVILLLSVFILLSCGDHLGLNSVDNRKKTTLPDYVIKHMDVNNKSYEYIIEDSGNIYVYDNSNEIIEVLNETEDSFESIGTIDIDEYGNALAAMSIIGETLYISQHTNTFLNYNITNPARPLLISEYEEFVSPENANSIGLTNNFAFIIENNSIRIVDISDPTSMTYKDGLGFIYAKEVFASGNTLFAIGSRDLKIYNISDIDNITLKSALSIEASSLFKNGDLLYIFGGWNLKLTIVDISDIYNPVILSETDWESELNIDSAYGEGFLFNNNTIYMLDRDEGILSIDVSESTNQVFNGLYPLATSDDSYFFLYNTSFMMYNDKIYVASESWGLSVIDPELF